MHVLAATYSNPTVFTPSISWCKLGQSLYRISPNVHGTLPVAGLGIQSCGTAQGKAAEISALCVRRPYDRDRLDEVSFVNMTYTRHDGSRGFIVIVLNGKPVWHASQGTIVYHIIACLHGINRFISCKHAIVCQNQAGIGPIPLPSAQYRLSCGTLWHIDRIVAGHKNNKTNVSRHVCLVTYCRHLDIQIPVIF